MKDKVSYAHRNPRRAMAVNKISRISGATGMDMQARLIQRAGRIKRIPQGHQRGRAAAASRQLALLGISVRIILERRIQDGSVMEVT